MSAFSCAETRDLAPELALGVLGGAERAEALEHVDGSGPCRTFGGERTDAADALPLLVPEAEPPLGFERRVVATFSGARRRAVRRWVAVVAATAAAATIVSVVVVRIAERDDAGRAPEAAVSDVQSVPMIGADGNAVGWAFVSDGRPAAVGVSVAYGLQAGRYSIELAGGTAHAREVGAVTITDGHGAWSGTAELPESGATAVRLVDRDGTVVCEATLAN